MVLASIPLQAMWAFDGGLASKGTQKRGCNGGASMDGSMPVVFIAVDTI